MSILNLDQLHPKELIARYVLETMGRQHFLAHEEYEIIHEWLLAAKDTDQVLLVLEEILPELYEKFKDRTVPPSLRRIRKRVLTRLKRSTQGSRSVDAF